MKKLLPIIAPVTVALVAVGVQMSQPLGGERPDLTELQAELESKKDSKGRYVQILKGGTPAHGKVFNTAKLPPNTYVNVYESPNGTGYQIVTEYPDRIEYIGFGRYAEDYTRTELISPFIASST